MDPRIVRLDLPSDPYSIHIENSWTGLAPAIKPFVGNKVMLISDENVKELFVHDVKEILISLGCQVSLAIIQPGESSKSLELAKSLYTQALNANLDRSSSVVALGGGVVGDLAGFVAATYMRGINFIQLPTTLLAQIDSSVGGKVAVNHPLAKNIIGSFYQPKSVFINLHTLRSLSDRQFSTGMAELIKYGFIWDKELLQWLEHNIGSLMERQKDCLAYAIERCCNTKAHIVSQDEKEKGLRAILNFGHTIGHGLESTAGYGQYTHGEAVALGMVYESLIAYHMGSIDRALIDLLICLLKAANLPTKVSGIKVESLIKAMTHDKKNRDGSIVFILPTGYGQVKVFDNVDTQLIYSVLEGS